MTLLGIETATAVCSVALVKDGAVLAENTVNQRYAHAEKLFGFLDDVLERSGVTLQELQGIAVSIGPGSFTGLRIGLSAAKGLHAATGIPVVPVPTLEALARNCADEVRTAGIGNILAVLDARREEVYWQLFGLTPAGVRATTDVSDALMVRLADRLPAGSWGITGEAREAVATMLIREGVDASRLFVVSEPNARCSAVPVAHCGAELLAGGATCDVDALEPRYIKEFFLRTPE
jgi:tRNA threonylcarbamoyladenosine biosynthesis protein TsaB